MTSARRLLRGFFHLATLFSFLSACGCTSERTKSNAPEGGAGGDMAQAGTGGRDVTVSAGMAGDGPGPGGGGVVAGGGGSGALGGATAGTPGGGAAGVATNAGTAGVAGSSGAAGSGASELDEAALRGLLGQYDLEFGDPHSSYSDVCGTESWIGARARLDLVEADGTFTAVVNPEWGPPATYAVVALTDGVLRLAWAGEEDLEICAGLSGDEARPAKRDWKHEEYPGNFGESNLVELRIGVESGALETAAEADFECLCVYGWDVGDMVWYSAVLTVRPDETGPRLRVVGEQYPPDGRVFQCNADAGTTPGLTTPPQDSVFPWDPVVECSEPVPASSMLEALEVATVGASANDVTSVSIHRFDGAPAVAFDDWDAVRGTTQALTQLQPLVDTSGNSGGQLQQDVEVLDVGPAQTRHDFDTFGSVAVWGNAHLDTDGTQCEQGGCAVLESTGLLRDPAPQTGIAGRLQIAGAERMRIRLSSNYGWGPGGNTPILVTLHYTGLRVERHVPEARPTPSIVEAGGAGPTDREWIWEEIDLDTTQSEVGFRIYLTGSLVTFWTRPAPEDEVIIIDEVLVE